MKKAKGITLIALVVTIIVMLILAGVSLNTIGGDNGIITNANKAKQLAGMAVLEEFLQMKYVENYEKVKEDTKVESLQILYPEYFYIPANENVGSLNYIVGSEGNIFYLIKKSGLPKEIRDGLVGGDAGKGTYSDYASLNDVYGVTSDLKVYYCSKDLDSLYGLAKGDLDKDDPNRVIFPANSPLANLIGEEGQPVTADQVKSVTELTLNADCNVTSLSEFYNLTSLKSLTLDGIQLDNLNGIENSTQLDYVYFQNYKNDNISIKDYSALSGVRKLKYLYILNSCNKQINDLCEGIKEAELSNLQYLGIFGLVNNNVTIWNTKNRIDSSTRNNNLTDISSLSKLSDTTKKAVEYLWINNNNITDISSLENFSSVKKILIANNAIKSLNGLQNMSNLEYLFGYNNNLGVDEKSELDQEHDSLVALKNLKKLYYLDIINNQNLKNVGYLSNSSSIKYLYLADCKNIQTSELTKLKSIFKNCLSFSYDTKYSLAMTDNEVERLDISGQTIKKSDFESLLDCTKLKFLNMKNTKIVNDTSNGVLSTTEINDLFNRIIPNFRQLVQLSLNGFSNLTDARFIKNLSNIERLDLRNTGILTNKKAENGEDLGLENVNNLTKIKQLGVNNNGTDLSKIQACLNRLTTETNSTASEIFSTWSYGLTCDNSSVWKTLENCSELTVLNIRTEGSESFRDKTFDLDLSKCSKLKTINCMFFRIRSLKVPNSCTYILQEGCEDMKLIFCEGSLLENLELCARFKEYLNIEGSFETINLCTHLKSLLIYNYSIPSNISKLASNNSLDTLIVGGYTWVIYDGQKGLENLNSLSGMTSLKNLLYQGDVNGVKSLDFIGNFSNLTTLEVSNTEISDISGISKLTNLTTISMFNNKFSDISVLENMVNCTSLNLSGNKISNVSPLRSMTKLKTLNLENNAIYDFAGGQSNLEVLANLHTSKGGQLTQLLLNGNHITDFSKVSSLKWPDGQSGF